MKITPRVRQGDRPEGGPPSPKVAGVRPELRAAEELRLISQMLWVMMTDEQRAAVEAMQAQ